MIVIAATLTLYEQFCLLLTEVEGSKCLKAWKVDVGGGGGKIMFTARSLKTSKHCLFLPFVKSARQLFVQVSLPTP